MIAFLYLWPRLYIDYVNGRSIIMVTTINRTAVSGIGVLAVLLALFCCTFYSVVFLSQ